LHLPSTLKRTFINKSYFCVKNNMSPETEKHRILVKLCRFAGQLFNFVLFRVLQENMKITLIKLLMTHGVINKYAVLEGKQRKVV